MIPSRYTLVDERSPYPVKRRVGRRGDRHGDPAVTLLPPDPYLIMEKPDFGLSLSPTVYRTTAPKSAKNKEASSFVILGDTIRTPVQSRPGSPSGRVSPFRGHGFKSPTTTRPNSRAASPSESPKRSQKLGKIAKTADRPRIGKDIGKPPKSPMKSKPVVTPITAEKTKTNNENTEAQSEEDKIETDTKPLETETTVENTGGSPDAIDKKKPKETEQSRNFQAASKPKQRLTPGPIHEKKPPVSPTPKFKTKPDKNHMSDVQKQSVIKRATKPPIPPKKIGMKTTLKAEEGVNEGEKKNKKDNLKRKEEQMEEMTKVDKTKEKVELKLSEKAEEKVQKGAEDKKKETEKKSESKNDQKLEDKSSNKTDDKNDKKTEEKIEKKTEEKSDKKTEEKSDKKTEEKSEKMSDEKSDTKVEENNEKLDDKAEKKPERLVPCFQPDKCQIAPPTMASPSPITTPTISTPSTMSSLAPAPTKTSPSIAAAPTSVTPSSLGSVSSTVVLGGQLAKKETERQKQQREQTTSPDSRVKSQMVKAASRDSVQWSPKDNSLSGEITSTKVIAAGPDMEVLSPNNLRDSPPRMAPPNVAWDEGEGRVPNGDVPNKAEPEGKFRRAISAVLRLLSYFFCCRCLSAPKCCRRPAPAEGPPKPSIFSRLNCFKSCRNPFKCCKCKSCDPKCCKCCECCRKLKCCRKKTESKPKPRKCCAKANCSCKGCCDWLKNLCLRSRDRMNSLCRSLFCLNTLCCQKFLRKFKCCHKFKCCQTNGFCSCCNPNVKKKVNKLNKKGSRTSNNSRDKDNLDAVLVEHTSLMKAAIPVLPSCLAVFCLILNLFVPGFGTFISGILCLCFGKPRFSVKDTPKSRFGSFVLNTVIGVAQLFTVVFCLVGWGWSIWWGVIMYKLSRRQKRLKLAEKNQKEAEGSNVNHNHVDVEQG